MNYEDMTIREAQDLTEFLTVVGGSVMSHALDFYLDPDHDCTEHSEAFRAKLGAAPNIESLEIKAFFAFEQAAHAYSGVVRSVLADRGFPIAEHIGDDDAAR